MNDQTNHNQFLGLWLRGSGENMEVLVNFVDGCWELPLVRQFTEQQFLTGGLRFELASEMIPVDFPGSAEVRFELEPDIDIIRGNIDQNSKRPHLPMIQWVPLSKVKRFAMGHGGLVLAALGRLWTNFGNEDIRDTIKSSLDELVVPYFAHEDAAMGDWVLFGGSFSPLHEGHIECIRQSKNWHKHVVVIPDRNPLKPNVPSNQCSFALAKEIYQEVKPHNVSLFPGFLATSRSNPTARWLKIYQGKRQLIMGMDSFVQLPQWQEWDWLKTNLDGIYVIPRKGDWRQSDLDLLKSELQSANPDLDLFLGKSHLFEGYSSTYLRDG